MYKKGAGNDKQGKDAGNRTLCPYRNFSQAIITQTCWFNSIDSKIDLGKLMSLERLITEQKNGFCCQISVFKQS